MDQLPVKAGPVADRISIWPLDEGRYGLDATFQGASGFERAEVHVRQLAEAEIPTSLVQELGGGWTLRLGPVSASAVAAALGAFVY